MRNSAKWLGVLLRYREDLAACPYDNFWSVCRKHHRERMPQWNIRVREGNKQDFGVGWLILRESASNMSQCCLRSAALDKEHAFMQGHVILRAHVSNSWQFARRRGINRPRIVGDFRAPRRMSCFGQEGAGTALAVRSRPDANIQLHSRKAITHTTHHPTRPISATRAGSAKRTSDEPI